MGKDVWNEFENEKWKQKTQIAAKPRKTSIIIKRINAI
jgi:hypothetical protein